MKVVIIGAGPAGLVACKTFLEAATPQYLFDPIVLEQEDDIGGTFRYRSYENSNLVSSKQTTAFSDFRVPLSHPDYLSLEEYVDYLRAYTAHFRLSERIRLNSKVIRVSRVPEGGHLVSYVRRQIEDPTKWETSATVIHADYVAVCSGLHVIPSIPEVPGIENVLKTTYPEHEQYHIKPEIYHSVDYKKRSQLANRRILILGTGETGMDLAYESAKAGAKEVVICSRTGFVWFPKALNNVRILGYTFHSDRPLPIDTLFTNFLESAYIHPWVAASRIRWFISDYVLKSLLWLLTGTYSGFNQWVGEIEPERVFRAYVAPNKSYKAMPYINRPYRSRSKILDYFARYIEDPKDLPPNTDFVVDLAPFPSHVLPNGRVVFPVSKRKDAVRIARRDMRPDTVIYATGFKQDFSFLDPEGGYGTLAEADLRNIVKSGDETIAFIGLVRPVIGAFPPMAELQTWWWIELLKGKLRKPVSSPHYHLLAKGAAKSKLAVEHTTYMSTLAKDIGAAPGLWELWREYGSHILTCYCFGAAFIPFYRLFGPYRSDKAPIIIRTELWETVTRRGILGNLLIGFIPMFFYGPLNLVAYVTERVGRILGLL